MLLLTNEQRRCFALSPVSKDWKLTEVAPSKYDLYSTYAYITPENIIRKVILEGENLYREYDVNETLSADRAFILPKTEKGKLAKFTAANLVKKTPLGMALSFANGSFVLIYSHTNECDFYNSGYAGDHLCGMSDFIAWMERWCAETGERELADIEQFANMPRRHIHYREGDFFRFRLDRHHFGYGRIILNYDAFRKKKIPFWDIFAGKPILAGIYHLVTENQSVDIEQLQACKMIPPQMIMDNPFFYGDYEIIGNLPVDESCIEFPVHYGASINYGDRSVMYQCGRTFCERKDTKPLFGGFPKNGIGCSFDIDLPLLMKCIQANSNQPYWDRSDCYGIRYDLRNPKYKAELQQIREQFGLDPLSEK